VIAMPDGAAFFADVLIGVCLTLLYFVTVTSPLLHKLAHAHRDGRFLKGRLVCHLCAEERAEITRDEWRNEVIERVRKVL
jgi:hypothetical protein